MSCRWCHNPESQLDKPEKYFRNIPLDGRHFILEETAGKWMTVEEVMNEIEKDRIFYNESSGGVTFSGGEPLMQPAFLLDLLHACKTEDLQTTLDTCGFAEKKIIRRMMDQVDLFLFDIKLLDDAEHLRYTGVSNKIILENLDFLAGNRKNVILRFPCIPSITDSKSNKDALKALAEKYHPGIREIDLLPYHSLAKGKYQRLNKTDQHDDIPAVSMEEIRKFKEELEKTGMIVKIGG